jgi:CO/xanthine dehydrogenase Mo-binding subunit
MRSSFRVKAGHAASITATERCFAGSAYFALCIKGVGEIGVTGTAGAIANAMWHATGIRVRQFPITLDRLIEPASG